MTLLHCPRAFAFSLAPEIKCGEAKKFREIERLSAINGRGRDEDFSSPTGSPEAVARPRLPQNVACGFPAPRSSAVGSQLSLLSVQVSFPWSADLLSE